MGGLLGLVGAIAWRRPLDPTSIAAGLDLTMAAPDPAEEA